MRCRTAIGFLAMGLLSWQSALAVAGSQERPPAWRATDQEPPAVVCDRSPSPPMEMAAAELRRYLGRILGVELPQQPAGSPGPAIRLAVQPDAELGDEGYQLAAEGKVCRITGGGPLGLLYGAYEFLYRCGCRFSDLGPDGEFVPRKAAIELDPGPVRMKPKLWYRGLQFSHREDAELSRRRIDWMAKNGLNYVMYHPAWEDPAKEPAQPPKESATLTKSWFDRELRPEIRKRGMKLDMNHHNFLYWLPTSRYRAEHPEWYALVDGKRGRELSQLCICTTNTEAVRTLIENVKTYLRENPEVKIVGVIPQDGVGLCQCEKCLAADADPQEAFRRPNYSVENRAKSSRYHRMLREVALGVGREFHHVLVGGAAYVDLLWPARDVVLPENTTMWVALYWRDGCRPMIPGNTSEKNQHFIDILGRWKTAYRGRLIVYEYYMGMSAQRTLPYPMWEVICADWPYLKKLGVEGATIQSWSGNHSTYVLNHLAFARSGWNDEVDPRQVLDDYLLGAYGAAGEAVRPVFESLLRAMRAWAAGPTMLMPNAENVRTFLAPESRPAIEQALATARAAAADDRERRQVERLAAAVRYWEMAADVFELRSQASRLQKTDRQAALVLLDRAVGQEWPRLREHLQAMPPGWLAGLTASRWEKAIDEMTQTAKKLRAQ